MAICNRLFLDQATGNGTGNFTSLAVKIDFVFEKNPEQKIGDDNSPSHFVYLKTPFGLVDSGAAWTKTVQDGPNRGAKFFSFSLDDPSFEKQLNLTAFVALKPTEKNMPWEYSVVWRRPRQKEAA